ncbi:hypothetical protein [Clostridium brassicae]|uniref:Uncharacterized protein n=1 Tax=Clostridium brassicae TaxID=2999072 RepID=A0ABT4DHL4_9CLOT|nr:hypothetical protein [Clostridium brassicae]MCY6960681.1 hypothetical protein [Clostridium brassicae]
MRDIRYDKKSVKMDNTIKSVSNLNNINDMESYSMAGNQQTIAIATNCSGYTPINNIFGITSSYDLTISCNMCDNFQNNVCQVGLYDKVLSNLYER